MRALALDWSVDGPVGTAFLVLVAAAGAGYLLAAVSGSRRDRRRRRWPRGRTVCFLAGLALLGGLPAFAIPALARAARPRWRAAVQAGLS